MVFQKLITEIILFLWNKLIHEQPSGTFKTACNYKYIKSIWSEFDWYIEGGDYYVGVQTKRGCPHNCCFCVYTVVEGKQVPHLL